MASAAPFFGADMWTAFELSWLGPRGKPQVALAHFTIPCETVNIIESKSFKLYLNSLNNTYFDSLEAVKTRLRADVTEGVWRGAQEAGVTPASIGVTGKCLVTSQPDWGSVQISYTGDQIARGGLLQYLVTFRNHNEFHEQCVECIFMDIWTRCKHMKLAVYARYTRRGGLDINPHRTSPPPTGTSHQVKQRFRYFFIGDGISCIGMN